MTICATANQSKTGATDGSTAAAAVLLEYVASHGLVVIAVPSRLELRVAADITRALTAFTRALGLLAKRPMRDAQSLGALARARQAIEEKVAKFRSRASSPVRGRPGP